MIDISFPICLDNFLKLLNDIHISEHLHNLIQEDEKLPQRVRTRTPKSEDNHEQ